MTTGDKIFRRLQAAARSTAARSGGAPPTQEYLIRHLLESFLDRLTHTTHATEFVLKGGILLAAYGVRRPTKDADANAIGINLTADDLTDVVGAIAAIDLPDGVAFDMDSITIQQIREQSSYPGLRVRINATIGPWKGTAVWDVSTGDPSCPHPASSRSSECSANRSPCSGTRPKPPLPRKASPSSNEASPAPGGATTSTSSNWLVKASTQTHCYGPLTQWPVTAALRWSRSDPTSRTTDASDRRNGQPGGAKNNSKPCQKRNSTTRSPSSPAYSTPSSRRKIKHPDNSEHGPPATTSSTDPVRPISRPMSVLVRRCALG